MNSNALTDVIKQFELLIDNNEPAFTERFCRGVDVMDIVKVSFSSSNMHIVWVAISGQSFADSYKLDEFQEWIDTI